MKARLASSISVTLNPFTIGAAAVLLLALDAATVGEALRWWAISLGVSMLPVLLLVLWRARAGRARGVLTATRRQRNAVYLAAIACAAAGYLVLSLGSGPHLLTAAFAGGLAGAILFAIINSFWKISLHSAFAAAVATLLVLIYGGPAAVSVLLALAVGWSRLELRQHTIAQVAAGTLLASGITLATFAIFRLL